MSADTPTTYQSNYRRTVLVTMVVLSVLALGVASLVLTLRLVKGGEAILINVLVIAGLAIAVMVAVGFVVQRVHRWQIETLGLRIHEGPRFRFTGLTMRSYLPYGDILGIKQIESGFDHQIEISTRFGAIHRLNAQLLPDDQGRHIVLDLNGLNAFESAIRAAMHAANFAPPSRQLGLSFWNTFGGLAVLTALFALSIVLAALVLWNLWAGSDASGAILKGAGLLLALPAGLGYLIVKSLRQRTRVLKQ